MSFLSALYQMLIGPLEILFEIVYGISYRILPNPCLAVIPVSLTINILLLPLYLRADYIQKEIRTKEKEMAPMLRHIKKTFKGDERYMMIQAFYRIEHYKPVYALKSSISLMLQVPFFIAAYHFMSNLNVFEGASFLFIQNLALPDGALKIGAFSINILPILMTAVNILSGSIYSKNTSIKDKIQLYGLALVFLVLLYNSPSGLVFYWLLNNLFSLGKNAVLSTKNPKLFFYVFLAVLGLFLFLLDSYSMFSLPAEVLLIALILVLPIAIYILKAKIPNLHFPEIKTGGTAVFLLGCALFTVMAGILIPSAVIADSPMEFILAKEYQSPLFHVLNAFLLAFGTFIIWFGIFYYLSTEKVRRIIEMILWVLSVSAIVNYMFFGTKLGTLLPLLQYEKGLSFSALTVGINIGVIVLLSALLIFLWMKAGNILKPAFALMILVMLGMSVYNIVGITKQIPAMKEAVARAVEEEPALTLSKDGKNVVVLILDKAVDGFVPYIFEEKPELKAQYDGFVWYPNTISYGNMTNVGSPALYGGYEYTPEEMNKRSDEWLGDKQNEAVKLMPDLFYKEGYEVTVCDPAYAGYNNLPDLSVFDEYPDMNTFLLDKGGVRENQAGYVSIKKNMWKRNFFCFSIMKMLPVVFQNSLYQNGTYYSSVVGELISLQEEKEEVISVGGLEQFLNAYGVLESMTDLTQIESGNEGAFVLLHNTATHSPVILQEPEYEPSYNVDNSEYDSAHKDRFELNGRILHADDNGWSAAHYHANVAALIQVGKWLDYLKEEGIYDNTRIIIVADHGASLRCFDDMAFGTGLGGDAMAYNPLLMVKDFGQTGEIREDDTFMTNADTPLLAFDGIVDHPVNPFTGKALSDEKKYEEEQHIFYTHDWNVDENRGNTFLPGEWYTLKNNYIFDTENWSFSGEY